MHEDYIICFREDESVHCKCLNSKYKYIMFIIFSIYCFLGSWSVLEVEAYKIPKQQQQQQQKNPQTNQVLHP